MRFLFHQVRFCLRGHSHFWVFVLFEEWYAWFSQTILYYINWHFSTWTFFRNAPVRHINKTPKIGTSSYVNSSFSFWSRDKGFVLFCSKFSTLQKYDTFDTFENLSFIFVFYFKFFHKSCYQLRASLLSDRTFVEIYIFNKIN